MSLAELERGKRAERDLVRWLRNNGWPHAERTVATGHKTPGRERPDTGDITGTPGICWQVTDRADLEEPAQLGRRLAATEQQRAAAGAAVGVLVGKRRGCGDPGRWHAWLPLYQISVPWTAMQPPWSHPIRLQVAHLVEILHACGYGDAPFPANQLEVPDAGSNLTVGDLVAEDKASAGVHG